MNLKGKASDIPLGNKDLSPTNNQKTHKNFNTIGFYDDDGICVMKARYPQNIKTNRKIPITLKVKMDW